MKKNLLLLVALCCCMFPKIASASETFIFAVAGGTGSGKTSIAKQIRNLIGHDVVVINQDSYYNDLSHLSFEERSKQNFDHPNAIDVKCFRELLLALKNQRSIQQPIYDFKTHTRLAETETVLPKRIIVVEGILILAMPEIRDLCDVKIYVDCPDDVRLLRWIERDIKERGRTFASAKKQYLETVRPMHAAFIEPSRSYADIIIANERTLKEAIRGFLGLLKQDFASIRNGQSAH